MRRAVSRLSAARQPGLAARAGRAQRFARLLGPGDPRRRAHREVGCGTGQMSLYLARADRVVVGADLTMASLRLAAARGGGSA
jgi:ubiquinone/menaquinone biosynthesis C-methylase UbiE